MSVTFNLGKRLKVWKTKPKKPRSRKRSGAVDQPQSRPSFPIIGIGASAGGLESLEVFFAHADPEGGMALVVIQHLDPAHKSIMSSLLKKYTTMDNPEILKGLDLGYKDPDAGLNVEGMKADLEWYKDHGYIDRIPSMEEIVDLQFAKAALKKVGKYK